MEDFLKIGTYPILIDGVVVGIKKVKKISAKLIEVEELFEEDGKFYQRKSLYEEVKKKRIVLKDINL